MANPTRTLPLEIEMVIYAGTDFYRRYRWLPNGVDPQDFTDWSGRLMIGPAKGTAALELTTEAGTDLTLSSLGIITIHLTGAVTDTITGTNLLYTFDLTDTEDITTRFMRGRVTVVRELDGAAP